MNLTATIYGKTSTLKAYKTKRPKFKHVFGRTWDYLEPKINGQEVRFIFDSTWGRSFYFSWEGDWYRLPMIQGKTVYDLGDVDHKDFTAAQ